jgi:hypothetical protein
MLIIEEPLEMYIHIKIMLIMRSLHDMNAYSADYVCLSINMIQLKNCWIDIDEIWYGLYAIGVYPKILLFNFLQLVIPIWWTNELVRWDRQQQHGGFKKQNKI